MPTVVELGKKVKAKYPVYGDMDDAELGRKVKAKFPGAYDDFTEEETTSSHPLDRAVTEFWDKANPANIVKGAAEMTASPVAAVQGVLGGGGGQYDRDRLFSEAQAAFKSGDYVKAARRAVEYSIPFLGPMLASPGDKAESGDIAGALGETAGIAVSAAYPKVVSSAPKVAAKVPAVAGKIVREGAIRATAKVTGVPTPIVREAANAVGDRIRTAAQNRTGQPSQQATRKPPAAEAPSEAPKAAPDARATADILADQLDEAVDSTTRANLAKKLTPEQMAEAEELAAAMGQPPGQRPSLGKVVVKDAEVGTEIAAANRTAQAEKMAAKLNETGITADMAQRMTPEQWRQVQYAAGADPRSATTHLEKPPSAATQAEAIEMLRKIEKPKTVEPKTPDAIRQAEFKEKVSKARAMKQHSGARAEAQAIEAARKAQSLFPDSKKVGDTIYTNHAGYRKSFIGKEGLTLIDDRGGGNAPVLIRARKEAARLREAGFDKPISVQLSSGKTEPL